MPYPPQYVEDPSYGAIVRALETDPDGSVRDEKVKAGSGDNASGSLADELEAGPGISLTLSGTAGTDRKLVIANTGSVAAAYIIVPVDDISGLKAIDTTSAGTYPDKCIIVVEGEGIYRLDRDSVAVELSPGVIQPTTGVGRWYRLTPQTATHNLASGLQGGASNEYYHLSAAQNTDLPTVITDSHTHANKIILDDINKLNATTGNPDEDDDSNQGYGINSRWINTVENREFVCLSADPNAAVWRETTNKEIEFGASDFSLKATISNGKIPTEKFIRGEFLFLAINEATPDITRVAIYNISNICAPLLVTEILIGDAATNAINDVMADGQYLYILTGVVGASLKIYDIGNVQSPTLISSTVLFGEPWSFDINAGYIYVTTLFGDTVDSIDCRDPQNPVGASSISLNTYVPGSAGLDVDIQGKYIYATSVDNNTFFVIDISDPYNMVVESFTTTGERPSSVEVSGPYVFIECDEYFINTLNESTVEVYDVTDPTLPVLVNTINIGLARPQSSSISGNYLFASQWSATLVFDIFDVFNPILKATIPYTDIGRGVHVSGNIMVDSQGFYINPGTIRIWKIPGFSGISARIDSLTVGKLDIKEDVKIYNKLDVAGGATIGKRGLHSNGPISAEQDMFANGIVLQNILTIDVGRNAAIVTDQYLRGPNGIPNNLSGFVLPFNASLVAISAKTNGSFSWTAEIRKNGLVAVLASLSITAAAFGYDEYSIDFDAGDEVQIYLNGTAIDNPRVEAIFKRRK